MFPQKFKKMLSKKNKNDPVTPSALVLPPHLHWNTASVWGDGLHPPTVKIPVTNRQTERLYWRAIFIMKQYWDQIETVVTWWLIPPLWSLPCPPPSWHAPCTAHLSSDAVKWTRYFHFSGLPPKARAIVSSLPVLRWCRVHPSASRWDVGVHRAHMRNSQVYRRTHWHGRRMIIKTEKTCSEDFNEAKQNLSRQFASRGERKKEKGNDYGSKKSKSNALLSYQRSINCTTRTPQARTIENIQRVLL